MIMRSASLFGVSLAFVLASACGGGNGNNDTCGDGQKTGSEQCDDGNTTSGDGCSATCTTESTSGHCGDGVVDVATEQCDDHNTVSGDGCSATCQNETSSLCGNGVINAPEACDDHNTASNDGCSSTCVVEAGYTCTGTPSVCTMGGGGSCTSATVVPLVASGTDLVGTGSGDTTGGTDHLPAAACDGDTAGGGPDVIYKFTTTAVKDVIITLNATTTFDGGIRLMTVPCDTTTEVIDVAGTDGCSDSGVIGDVEALGYINLPAGTYYLSVDGYTATDFGMYDFTITASPPGCGDGNIGPLEVCDDGNTAAGDGCDATCSVEPNYNCTAPATGPSVCEMIGCGDGILQTGETCDDHNTAAGDGCDATCHIESGYICDTTVAPSVCAHPGCGNHILEPATEECEDGNTTAGDRCSPTCTLEFDTLATEPNDTTPQVLTPGNHIIKGTFSDTDVDLYSFTLTQTSTVELETYFTINGNNADYGGAGTNPAFDCTTADDTGLALFAAGVDVTMDPLAIAVDGDDGDSYCSYLGLHDSANDSATDVADPTQLVNLAPGTYTIKLYVDPSATPPIGPRRYMLDVKITPMNATPVVPAAGDIVINEFLAADGSTMNGGVDSNCDGNFTNSDDEFIEFVNVSAKVLDLTGLTVKDGGNPTATPPVPPQLEFTFAPQGSGSLTLNPGKAVVVWAGGSPNCPGVTDFFTAPAAQHTLSLNDAGDSITLATGGATPVTITTITYPAQTIGTSSNLNPDVTGTTYSLSSAITGHVGNVSPGKKNNGTAF